MKSTPYIDLGLPRGENSNPSVRLVIHGTPVNGHPLAFVYFCFGIKDRIDPSQLLNAETNVEALSQTLSQKVWINSREHVSLRDLIAKEYFAMYWIRENGKYKNHAYWYEQQVGRGSNAKIAYALKKPRGKTSRWSAKDIRPWKSEMVHIDDFQDITQKAESCALEDLYMNEHSTRYMRTKLGVVGPTEPGGLNPLFFMHVELESRLLLIGDMGVTTQVIEGYKELCEGATLKSFLFECALNGERQPDAQTNEEGEEDADASVPDDEGNEEKEGEEKRIRVANDT